MYRNMLLIGLISLLALTPTHSLQLLEVASPFAARSQNTSAATTGNAPNLDRSLPQTYIDPHFSYDIKFGDQILDKMFAYMNTVLALADLSTKGWTQSLRWESLYSFSTYGDVTIRIHASQNPSSLQYRLAMSGLYTAILETSANEFKSCVLTLYWTPIPGKIRHTIGYVSILGNPSMSVGTGNSTEDAIELALPTQSTSPDLGLANFTTTINGSSTLVIETADKEDLQIGIKLQDRGLDIDAVFYAVNSGIMYLASRPQLQAITEPGVVEDRVTRTFLRWDATHHTAQPFFQYRHVILALVAFPVYMYKHQFQEARCIVYVDEMEVGRGVLYSNSRDAPNAE